MSDESEPPSARDASLTKLIEMLAYMIDIHKVRGRVHSQRHILSANNAAIAAEIRGVIRRRRLPLAKAAEFLGVTPEVLGRILIGCPCSLPPDQLAGLLARIKMWLDPCTFGGTPAAINLAAILSEMNDKALSRNVAVYIAAQSECIKALGEISAGRGKNGIRSLLRRSWQHALPEAPTPVRSHMINVLVARLRHAMGEHGNEDY